MNFKETLTKIVEDSKSNLVESVKRQLEETANKRLHTLELYDFEYSQDVIEFLKKEGLEYKVEKKHSGWGSRSVLIISGW